MTRQEKQIHTKGVLFSVSASKENTAGGSVSGTYQGRSEDITALALPLLVGMQTSPATMENSVEIP